MMQICSETQNILQLVEKSRFKAGSYMNEINQRDSELSKMRKQQMSVQDEIKTLTVTREKFRQQKEVLEEQLRDRNMEIERQKRKLEEQQALIDRLCVAQKVVSGGGAATNLDLSATMDKARDDIERADRIAKQTVNRNVFMPLGEKQAKLVSEEGHYNIQQNVKDHTHIDQRDDSYLTDESIPSDAFTLIQQYREKIKKSKGGAASTIIIDDFFSDLHRILKDSHMREIARIRNEHSVEIMKLRKNLESKLKDSGYRGPISAKENLDALRGKDKFIENEIERQRRALLEENEVLKMRLRGAENIITSTTNERTKFMEGASWVAKKAHLTAEKHINKMQGVLGEFQRKAQDVIIDHSISEVDGREAIQLHFWMQGRVEKEIQQLGEGFEILFENVNYHLKEATKELQSKKSES